MSGMTDDEYEMSHEISDLMEENNKLKEENNKLKNRKIFIVDRIDHDSHDVEQQGKAVFSYEDARKLFRETLDSWIPEELREEGETVESYWGWNGLECVLNFNVDFDGGFSLLVREIN